MYLNIRSTLRSLFLFGLTLQCSLGVIKSDTDKWTGIGPYTGLVLAIAIDPSAPSTIYAGTLGAGVFKSTDGATNWVAASTGLFNDGNPSNVNSLAIDRTNTNIIFAGTFSGLFKTTNGGGTWSRLGKNIFFGETVAIAPSNSNIIYASSDGSDDEENGFKSTEIGTTWAGITNGLDRHRLFAIAVDPSNSDLVYLGTENGVFK